MLRDDANVLYQDMRQEPEKYDPDAVTLVTQLVARKRELTKEERQLLDLAVLDLNRALPVKEQPRPTVVRTQDRAHFEEPEAMPVAGVDFPAGLQRPFWWL